MQKIMQMDEKQRRARVLNLLFHSEGGNFSRRADSVRDLLYWKPEAREVRFEDKCPNCRKRWLVSYRLPDDGMRGDREQCGFYCGVCRWGTGGTREVWVRKGGRG